MFEVLSKMRCMFPLKQTAEPSLTSGSGPAETGRDKKRLEVGTRHPLLVASTHHRKWPAINSTSVTDFQRYSLIQSYVCIQQALSNTPLPQAGPQQHPSSSNRHVPHLASDIKVFGQKLVWTLCSIVPSVAGAVEAD